MARSLPKKWPRSKDNLYSPSIAAVTALVEQRQRATPFYENRAELNRRRDRLDLEHTRKMREISSMRRYKREELLKQAKQSESKKLALSNARLYYNFLREQARHYTKADLLLYVKHSALRLKKRHHREY